MILVSLGIGSDMASDIEYFPNSESFRKKEL